MVAFDAFGTLFKPKGSVAKQYAIIVSNYGVQTSPDEVDDAFRHGESMD